MSNPLVTVICICHNHAEYIAEAIDSVLRQAYEPIELIVVDDASTDNSIEKIEELAEKHVFKVFSNSKNLGNCKSFNLGFHNSSGSFLIDLAADDLLLPERVMEGVNAFIELPEDYGVHFSDVEFINSSGVHIGYQYSRNASGNILETVPTGDIYKDLLARHFISAPAMLIKRAVFEALDGYDESLSYEDFDFWVRSSRFYKYAFSDQVPVKKRILKHSLSSARYAKNGVHILSTARVCEKALNLNKTKEEDQALQQRCYYELKWAIATENWLASQKLFDILKKLGVSGFKKVLLQFLINTKPPVYWLTKTWLLFKKGGRSTP